MNCLSNHLIKIHQNIVHVAILYRTANLPSLAVLHTEKQAFQYAALQSCLIRLQCSYMHSIAIQCKQACSIIILSRSGKGCHIYVCVALPTHVARGRKHCKHMASLYKHGTLQGAITNSKKKSSFIFVYSCMPV